jgi:hypothetical protein
VTAVSIPHSPHFLQLSLAGNMKPLWLTTLTVNEAFGSPLSCRLWAVCKVWRVAHLCGFCKGGER